MEASMAQTTIDQAGTSGLNVNYGLAVIIEAQVIIFPPIAAGGEPIFAVPVISIPGTGSASVPARCEVIWTLEAGSDAFTKLQFSDQSFAIPSPADPPTNLPHGLTILDSGLLYLGAEPKRWRVRVENMVLASTNFNYNIGIDYKLKTDTDPDSPELRHASHDPTIVVTPEPIGGTAG